MWRPPSMLSWLKGKGWSKKGTTEPGAVSLSAASHSGGIQPQDTWQASDFPPYGKDFLGAHGITVKEYNSLRKDLIGKPVAPQRFSDKELQESGVTWKEYLLDGMISHY